MRGESRVTGYFIEGDRSLLDSLPAGPHANQDRVRIAMVRALRQWLEAHQLPAIIAGVVGGLVLLSMLLVLGGYFLVTP
jgi:hypothetical protein